MAAATVGGAFLSSFLNVVFDRLSKPEVVNWIRGKKLDQKLLQRLENILYVVQAVLNDAEQKQIIDPAVKKWLVNLQDCIYNADDLLDEVSNKAATQKHPGNFWSRFLNFQDREMATRIEELIDTLEEIAKHKDILGLKNIAEKSTPWRTPSTSLIKMSDTYGRDEDREAIVNLLLDDTNDSEISVIPIVGMGGIGKTTLAQLVYNDDRVKQKFDFKVWICVGEEFYVLKMTKTVLGVLGAGAEASSFCDTNDLDSIQLILKNKLTRKKFLVVLDDMWNDNYDCWKVFQNPFQYGSVGSKILVTTRNDKVASVVRTDSAYKLNLLSDEYCWLVFAKNAFLSIESPDFPTLEKVGRKIVKKCKGLPLAAQTLGGLLRTKNEVADWNYILKSEIWEFSDNESRILPALRISYHFLPSYLKRCFVYCSLYPKDHEFDRNELTLLWMAEDLLRPPKSGSTLEEIGYKYFNDLASRSFFQPSSNTDDNLFVMHDMIHDLATFCAGEFYFRASKLEIAPKIDIKTRHLSYNVKHNFSVSNFLNACDRLKQVRTLLQIDLYHDRLSSKETTPCISRFLSQLTCLRVLSFQGFPLHGDSLLDSIGELIHLRYLDLSSTPIMTLPESLNNLHNLQTLKLVNCHKLKMLPSSLQDLVNLRHLDIKHACLEEMPKGMNQLKNLQFLSGYIVGKHKENGIRELGALTSLHGSLSIHNLENVIHSDEALEARMADKKYINVLKLIWLPDGDVIHSQIERDILDKLQPCMDLKELSIIGYRGTIFPDWLGHSSYHSMTDLELKRCSNCCMLPSLGQLPSLKSLRLENFDSLEIIGAEFYKNGETCQHTPFPSLKKLEFCKMSSWQEWQSFESDAFPQLQELRIQECPMLTGDLPSLLSALKILTIDRCDQLACSLPRAPAILKLDVHGKQEVRIQELSLSLLCSLSIFGSQQVESVFDAMTHTQPTCLKTLRIEDCSSAISFPGACLPASLQELEIKDCKNLEFPMHQQQQQQQHDLLHSLEIRGSCDSLTSFPLSAFPNLTYLKIERCENTKSLEVSQSQDAPLLRLYDLTIKECPSFVSLLSQSRNAALPSLRFLEIESCPNFASFSALGLAAPQLESLNIHSCPETDSLAEGEAGLPPNLRSLHITRCEKLVRRLASSTVLHSYGLTYLLFEGACDGVKSFPREGCLPASLQFLRLYSFPSLETLDCNGFVHLTSLQDLIIVDCPRLANMAGGRLPASLTGLLINRCPLLGEHLRTKDPQIWPKVSHIPRIIVNGRRIS